MLFAFAPFVLHLISITPFPLSLLECPWLPHGGAGGGEEYRKLKSLLGIRHSIAVSEATHTLALTRARTNTHTHTHTHAYTYIY